MVRLERLRRLANGTNKDYSPKPPILLQSRFRARLERLWRVAKGDKKD